MTYVSQSARFRFDTYLGAAEALLCALEDARKTKKNYRITGLTPEKILTHGILVVGEIDIISEKLAAISGATPADV